MDPGESNIQTSVQLQDNLQGLRLVYSSRCGRILLKNVTVLNKGVDWAHESNIYWQHKVRPALGTLSACHGPLPIL